MRGSRADGSRGPLACRRRRPFPRGVRLAALGGGGGGGAGEGDREPDREAGWSLSSPRVQILAVLLAVFIANQACRALPFYLVDFGPGVGEGLAMNQELGFGAAEYGVYASLGFSVPFTFFALFAGAAADDSDRLRFAGVAGLVWSAATAAMAVAGNFETVAAERLLLGASQAVTNPTSLSLIGDLFPEARATAASVFGLGIYLGGGLAALGAKLDAEVGWRLTCLAFGAASAVTSLLAFRDGDPKVKPAALQGGGVAAGEGTSSFLAPLAETAGKALADAPQTLRSAPAEARKVLVNASEAVSPAPAKWLLLGTLLRFMAGFAIFVWFPPAVRINFPDDMERFAFINSFAKAVVGGASSLAGGVLADNLRARGFGEQAGALICAVSSLLAAPLWFFVLYQGASFESCMGFLLVEYLVAELWMGPAIATLQGVVEPSRRGTAQGVFSSLSAVGSAFPSVLGFLPPTELPEGLQVSVAACYLLSGLCFLGLWASLPPEEPPGAEGAAR